MKLASFDIFDTCLVRACGQPNSIFDIMGKELFGANDNNKWRDFANERCKAEKRARFKTDNTEVTLKDIYQQADFTNITETNNETLMDIECMIEASVIIGVDSIRTKIASLREQGYSIAFISDMYLSSDVLKQLLIRERMYQEGDSIFVSSEYLVSKSHGLLFNIVKEHYKYAISEWIHFGDNRHSDGKMPLKYGIKANLINHKYTVSEQQLIQLPYIFDNGRNALIASISKAVRLSFSLSPEINFSADYIAPLFVPFVFDILTTANKEGINSLYFIARDGLILYEIAKELGHNFPNISLHYIYLSRSSLYFPALEDIHQLTEIIDENKVADYNLSEIIFNYCGVKIDNKAVSKFKSVSELIKDEQLRELLTKRHNEQRELLFQYFLQTQLATDSAINGIVDLRGTGKTHRMINRLLESKGYRPVKAFYLELGKSRKPQPDKSAYHSIINNERYFGGNAVMLENPPILESVYAVANHSRTVGYKLDEHNRVVPVFEDDIQLELNKKLFSYNKAAVCLWAKLYLATKAYFDNNHNLYVGLSLLKNLLVEPPVYVLKLFSKVQVSETGIEKTYLVKKLSLLEILNRRTNSRGLTWFTGSFSYTFGYFGNSALKLLKHLSGLRHRLL